jgi:hypothetical protein
MPRNNSDFQQAALFHGTVHPFQIGDAITPQGDEPYAFATPDLDYAEEHAGHRETLEYSRATRSGKPEDHAAAAKIAGRVFQVEPISDDSFRHSDNTDAVVSKTGFRVVKQVK